MRDSAVFLQMKQNSRKIAMLTAYDAPTARTLEEAGIDVILVGDSVGTNMLGYASERDVTMDDMVHHIRAVRRGAPKTFIIGDLPWGACATPALAVENSGRLRDAGADMVKFEGALPDILRAISGDGIPVCCHLGLEPQNHTQKRLQGRSAQDARKLVTDATMLDAAGMAMLVLELVPEQVAEAVTRAVRAPTIGIGAGRRTDGQVLVIVDVLGFTAASYKHNKRYADVGAAMTAAAHNYVDDVHKGNFPAQNNAFQMAADEAAAFGG